MKAIFVNGWQYAFGLVSGIKTIETRSRDMLRACVGDRVAVVYTGGKAPVIVGYVTITRKSFCTAEEFPEHYEEHLVTPGSKFDCKGAGKWFYYCDAPETCDPYILPKTAVRHGRSWCEF